jgi:NAD-dependent SIR2 family protein deacetylase
MLAGLADEGRLLRLYTQNVDGIDTAMEPLKTDVPLKSRGPWPRTIQLHGSLQKMVCTKCYKMSDLQANLFDGPMPPSCHMCKTVDIARKLAGKRSHGIGRLRPRMVLYNEHNPDDEAIGSVMAADLRMRPDALIVVGTTLKVRGVKRIVKEMCRVVRGCRGGQTVWINTDAPPPSKDYEWDLIVSGECDRVAEHADIPRWEAEPLSGARPSPRSTHASSRPASPTMTNKPTSPLRLKKTGASRGTISFPVSKAAAVLAEAGKQPSLKAKEPMHPLSPMDLNARALNPASLDSSPKSENFRGGIQIEGTSTGSSSSDHADRALDSETIYMSALDTNSGNSISHKTSGNKNTFLATTSHSEPVLCHHSPRDHDPLDTDSSNASSTIPDISGFSEALDDDVIFICSIPKIPTTTQQGSVTRRVTRTCRERSWAVGKVRQNMDRTKEAS